MIPFTSCAVERRPRHLRRAPSRLHRPAPVIGQQVDARPAGPFVNQGGTARAPSRPWIEGREGAFSVEGDMHGNR